MMQSLATKGLPMPLCRLDEVVDAHKITGTLLDVMPTCSKSVQQGVLELLPELVLEEDCQVIMTCIPT